MRVVRTCRGASLVLLAAIWVGPRAEAMECPDPPVQSRKDWNSEVSAEVGRIGVIRGAQLDTKVRTATQDLMGKLPGADRVYLEQMMFSAYCSALNDDKTIAGAEKSRQILEYRRALSSALRSDKP